MSTVRAHMARSHSDRLVSVQILRGVAALLVVWLHLNVALRDVEASAGPSFIGRFAQTFPFGAIGVDIFFLVSGFAMAFTMDRYAGRPVDFIRQRFFRVAPLAYLAAAVWITILLAGGQPVTSGGIISCITFLPLLPHYTEPTLQLLWTLSFEFTFYLLVMVALVLRFGPRQLLWIVGTLGATGFLITLPVPLLRWLTHPLLLEFALGIGAFLVWRTVKLSRTVLLCLGALSIVILTAEALLGVPIETNPTPTILGAMAGPRLVLWALPSFFGLVALLHWRAGGSWPVRAAQRLGDASYSIYLTHLIPVRAAAYFLPLAADLRWLVGLAAAVATGLAVHHHIERPLLRLSKGRDSAASPLQMATS